MEKRKEYSIPDIVREVEPTDTLFDIALVPPKQMCDRAMRVADQIESIAALSARVDSGHLPHVTLFQGACAANMLPDLTQVFHQFATGEFNGFYDQLIFRDRLLVRPNGNIFWLIESTPSLAALHERTIELFRPITQNKMMKQFLERLKDPSLSDVSRKAILSYGVELAGSLYLPHMTIGKLADLSKKSLVESLVLVRETMVPAQLVLGTIDDAGAVTGVVEQHDIDQAAKR